MAKIVKGGLWFVSDVAFKMGIIVGGFLAIEMLCISGCK